MPTRGEEETLPPPPADLSSRVLPLVVENGPWTRMHPVEHDPVYFGKTGLGRFDDPEGEYGVLYVAEDALGAFVESFGRTPGRNIVSSDALRRRPLSTLEPGRPLRLVDLTGSGLARIGATAAVFTDANENAQAWSRALHDHPEAPDGLRYRLKHDPSKLGVAYFDRGEAVVIQAQAIGTLVAADHRKLLAAILKEYGFGLVGGP